MFRDTWLTSIYQHTRFIASHLSRFSSANNHLIGELTGLFVAGCVWPFCKDIESWRARGYDMLVHETLIQTSADGVNREQAVGYQQYVMDFMLIASLAGGATGIEFPQAYWDRLERMMEFIASLMDVRGNMPMIGDADDGYAVRLSQEPDFCPFRSLLATGAVLFGRGDLKAKAGRLDDKTKWLLGQRAQAYLDLPTKREDWPVHKAFVEGGYYILGTDFEQANEIRLVVDAGPLGYPSIAAHGHADALSVLLSIGGRDFLIDPGTYAYHTKEKWRNYFRGTAAHNTIRVDETDQSVSGGNFMWIQHATARCEAWAADEQADFFVGSHDGYRRLPDPVTHRRQIRFDKETKRFEIEDKIVCKGAHRIESAWHFSEQCTVCEREGAFLVENGGQSITLSCGDNHSAALQFYGDLERPAGWISRRYDVKLPTTTIIWRMQIVGDTTLHTLIDCSQNEPANK
jgi:hypothetical protein